ncbi:hypothetical protein [Nonlabens ponticola]|uniref:Uncharacterized protein n=1 Tax=Nonlabens ponticola TaxID=2496866 RepID=A0A3S9MZV3_9FLAO|nr:hypothetical protein [Nonlabens ponticola]AZQ44700.1 hypothetical protein EJ995_10780 [Nonlabens ponticola]
MESGGKYAGSMSRTIGIWCEHNFQVYSAIPLIEKYTPKNKVILFTKKQNVAEIRLRFNVSNLKVQAIEPFVYKPAVLFKKFFELALVPVDFSYVYKNYHVGRDSKWESLVRKLFFLKLSGEKVNRLFVRCNKLLFGSKNINSHFHLDLLISFTKVYYSHLIPSPDTLPHISIMESWDHPMKFPYYLKPSFNLTWNTDLANETRRVQSIDRVRKIEPLKFHYINKYSDMNVDMIISTISNKAYSSELSKLRDKKIVLYPSTTSSAGLNHEGEMKLIEELAEILINSSYQLYIKPKPNAPSGDYAIFEKHPNVIVGIDSSSPNASDMLDEEYHMFRYALLNTVHTVINAGTTFALEASLVDKPIIQLVLDEGKYLGFDEFCKTYHLSEYVLTLDRTLHFPGPNPNEFQELISKREMTFSHQLKKWITN